MTTANKNCANPKTRPDYAAPVATYTDPSKRGGVYRTTKYESSIEIPISLELNHPLDRLILKMQQLACYIRMRVK